MVEADGVHLIGKFQLRRESDQFSSNQVRIRLGNSFHRQSCIFIAHRFSTKTSTAFDNAADQSYPLASSTRLLCALMLLKLCRERTASVLVAEDAKRECLDAVFSGYAERGRVLESLETRYDNAEKHCRSDGGRRR